MLPSSEYASAALMLDAASLSQLISLPQLIACLSEASARQQCNQQYSQQTQCREAKIQSIAEPKVNFQHRQQTQLAQSPRQSREHNQVIVEATTTNTLNSTLCGPLDLSVTPPSTIDTPTATNLCCRKISNHSIKEISTISLPTTTTTSSNNCLQNPNCDENKLPTTAHRQLQLQLQLHQRSSISNLSATTTISSSNLGNYQQQLPNPNGQHKCLNSVSGDKRRRPQTIVKNLDQQDFAGVKVASMLSSSKSRAHKCKDCNRVFSRSDMLARHSRLHSGLKPFECNRCKQVFSRSDHLATHERTHTGEKPYRCNLCKYSACRRDMITRHMRTHSQNNSLPKQNNVSMPIVALNV